MNHPFDKLLQAKDQRIAELEAERAKYKEKDSVKNFDILQELLQEKNAELALKDKTIEVLAEELADPYTETTDEPYEINLPNSWIEWAIAKAKETK